MNRETIMEQLNADDWSTVVGAFDGRSVDDIEAELDAMFPREDNGDLARAIEAALGELEHSFYLDSEELGEFVFDGYAGTADEIWIEFPKGSGRLTRQQVKELHAYLTHWLEARGD